MSRRPVTFEYRGNVYPEVVFPFSRAKSFDPFVARVAGPAAVVLAVTCGLILASALWAAHRSDALAVDRQRAVVARAVAVQRQELMAEQATVAVWDDAVARLASPDAADLQWTADNIGLWLAATYGHDAVFVLGSDDRPVYGMIDGATVDPARYGRTGPELAGLVARLRAGRAKAASDLIAIDGAPAFASVSQILPLTSAKAPPAAGREALLVSVVKVEGGFVEKLGQRNLLRRARFARGGPGSAEVAAPLTDQAGRARGYVAWRPDLPGRSVLAALLPTSALAIGLVIAVVFAVLRHLRKVTGRLRASQAHAQHLAFHDVLTGLPNRALFQDRLEQALARVRRGEARVALLYLDLDRFKAVNDRLGHQGGDILIQAFAQRVGALLRESDTLARFGGDEFAIVLGGAPTPEAVEALCDRLRQSVAAPFEVLGSQAVVGVSIGVALAPDHGVDRGELARRADIALYHAKDHGRDRASVFVPSMDESVFHRARIEADLRAALAAKDQLEVHYQPLLVDQGRRLTGMEALVRWRHPEHGFISPAQFIPIAEDTGLIVALGEWVLAQACRVAAQRPDVVMSVNVSAVQLGAPDAADRLLSIVQASGADPRKIELEITETAILEARDSIAPTIERLRAAGVGVALDDFGTGYSSLTHLQAFSVDKIKIDSSFVQKLGRSPDALAIVGAVVGLARAMNIRVTAEGVETIDQMRVLTELGCAEMQGYLFSAAVPVDRLPPATGLSGLAPAA